MPPKPRCALAHMTHCCLPDSSCSFPPDEHHGASPRVCASCWPAASHSEDTFFTIRLHSYGLARLTGHVQGLRLARKLAA